MICESVPNTRLPGFLLPERPYYVMAAVTLNHGQRVNTLPPALTITKNILRGISLSALVAAWHFSTAAITPELMAASLTIGLIAWMTSLDFPPADK